MGRSVNYLTRATQVIYLQLNQEDDDPFAWDSFMNDITEILQELLPSLSDANRWDGNETAIFLQNNIAEFGVSEYCGLVSLSARPLAGKENLGERWLAQAWPKINQTLKKYRYSPMDRVGSFSNGESIYKPL